MYLCICLYISFCCASLSLSLSLYMVRYGYLWMVYHGMPWHTIVLWYIMVYHAIYHVNHGMPWYTMVYHGISWYTMADHGMPWQLPWHFHDNAMMTYICLGFSPRIINPLLINPHTKHFLIMIPDVAKRYSLNMPLALRVLISI